MATVTCTDFRDSRFISTWYEPFPHEPIEPYLTGFQIPKPDQEQGLGITWPAKKADMEKLKEYFNDVKAKI